MSCFNRKLCRLLQCNHPLNKKAVCIKRSWDEVSAILEKACCNKRNCCGCKKK